MLHCNPPRSATAKGPRLTSFGDLSLAGTQRLCLSLVAAALLFSGAKVHAGGVVSTPDESSLRAALAGGGTVTFASDGVIELSSTLAITNDTIIDAAGHTISLSGRDAVRVLHVGEGAQLELRNLTITRGRTNEGGGLYSAGGDVTVSNCIFSLNSAVGTNGLVRYVTQWEVSPGQDAYGGAIYLASGALEITDSFFRGNRAVGGQGTNPPPAYEWPGSSGGRGAGGAIYSKGTVAAAGCLFETNTATGGESGRSGYMGGGGDGGQASGGAVENAGGELTVLNCTFEGNTIASGFGLKTDGSLAGAYGGAICNKGVLGVLGSDFTSNVCTGAPASGGAIYNNGVLTSIGGSYISNACGGARGSGTGMGGAICHSSGTATVRKTVFRENSASGDYWWDLGTGLDGSGGALFNAAVATLTDCLLVANRAHGGNGHASYGMPLFSEWGRGGAGSGGGVYSSGTLEVVRCTFTENFALGGVGSPSTGLILLTNSGGPGRGGALFIDGYSRMTNCTVYANQAFGGEGGAGVAPVPPSQGGPGSGGGVFVADSIGVVHSVGLVHCTVATNIATAGLGGLAADGSRGPSGTNSGGGLYNVRWTSVSVTNSIVGINMPDNMAGAYSSDHNLIGADPLLGPLAYNGGLTPTLALQTNSPALDAAIPIHGVDKDQRGVPRPYGSAPDIGAYEWAGSTTAFVLTGVTVSNDVVRIGVSGPPLTNFRILISSDLVNWVELKSGTTDAQGQCELEDTSSSGAGQARLYRVVSP